MEQVLAWLHSFRPHGWDTEAIGYVASALVLVTFSVRSMCALRAVAIASNLAFISCGIAAGMRPILILHGILLPVNILRLTQDQFERRRCSSGNKRPARSGQHEASPSSPSYLRSAEAQ